MATRCPPFLLQGAEDGRTGEAPIQPDAEPGLGEGMAELPKQPPQNADHPPGGVGIARPQDGGHKMLRPLAVEGEHSHERQVAPTGVMAVEEGELLLPVRGILRGVEVDGDSPDPLSGQPDLVGGDDHVGEGLGEPVQVPRPNEVLEAGEGGLRGQGRPREGVAADEELLDRIGLEVGRIVRIGVAAGEAEAALPDERGQIVFDLPRLAPLGKAGRQPGGQGELVVDRFEQDGAAVGALVGRVEGGNQRFVEERGEQHRLYSLFDHLSPPSVRGTARPHRG